jgi:hypothetical protein
MQQLRSFVQCFGPSHLCGRRPADPALSCRAALAIVLSCAALVSRCNPGSIGMHAEIFAIGTELLLGELMDANSAWLAARLPALAR